MADLFGGFSRDSRSPNGQIRFSGACSEARNSTNLLRAAPIGRNRANAPYKMFFAPAATAASPGQLALWATRGCWSGISCQLVRFRPQRPSRLSAGTGALWGATAALDEPYGRRAERLVAPQTRRVRRMWRSRCGPTVAGRRAELAATSRPPYRSPAADSRSQRQMLAP